MAKKNVTKKPVKTAAKKTAKKKAVSKKKPAASKSCDAKNSGEKSDESAYRNSFGLTKKQEAFAQAIITEDTLSDAYRKAYDCSNMTDKSINERASVESKDIKIASRVAELRDRAEKAADVTLERWMREQARIAFADPLELYNDDGTLKPLSEISPDARATIAGIETESRVRGNGKDAQEIIVRKVKQHSKTAAQESIGRALGAYEKDNNQRRDIIPVIVSKPGWLEDDTQST